MLKIRDVAERLSISDNTAKRLLLGGKIPYYRVGRQFRIEEADLDAYIESIRCAGQVHEQAKARTAYVPFQKVV